MKLVLIACAIAGFVGSSFAGGTATWNPYLQRWEYRDEGGNNTGTGTWNPYLGRYEFRDGGGNNTGTATWNPYLKRWEYSH